MPGRACRLLRRFIHKPRADMATHPQDPSPAEPGPAQVQAWADEFDATVEQIHEAIAAVGAKPADIEMHLKGSRSTSNSDRVRDAGP